jgi:hypothetical protein
MTHDLTSATIELLKTYFVAPERGMVAAFTTRGFNTSRKIRRAIHSPNSRLPHRVKSVSEADFSDVESRRVFDAAVGAVARELGRQAGREWFDLMAGKERR